MSDNFWQALHLDILWPLLIPQIAIMIKQWLDGRRAKEAAIAAREAQQASLESRAHLSAKIDENTQITASVKDAAERSQMEVSQAFMAGQRSGFVGGIEEGKNQATRPAPLGDK